MRRRVLPLLASLAVLFGALGVPLAAPARAGSAILTSIWGTATRLGLPVQYVTIQLTDDSGNVMASDVTADDGTYDVSLNNEPDFVFHLWVDAAPPYVSGYLNPSGGFDPDLSSDNALTTGGVDLNEDIAVERQNNVTGTIVRDDTAPLSGAVTACLDSGSGCATFDIDGNSGAYTGTLTDGQYTFTYTLNSGASLGYYGASAAGHFTTDESKRTVVSISDDTTLPTITAPSLYHVSGSVAGPDLRSVRACEVRTATCVSVAVGGFSFDLHPGDYTFFFDAPLPAKSGWYSQAAADHFVAVGGVAPVISIASDTVLKPVVLPGAGRIAGTVAFWLQSDSTVQLVTPDGAIADSTLIDGPPGNQSFSFEVAPGTYKVHVLPGSMNAEGWYSVTATSHMTRSASLASTVTVPPSTAPVTLQKMTLTMAYAAVGTIVFRSGPPRGVADVVLRAYDSSNNLVGTAVTDSSGNFYIGGLVPGTYTFGINLDGANPHVSSGWLHPVAGIVATPAAVSVFNITQLDISVPYLYEMVGRVFGGLAPAAHVDAHLCTVANVCRVTSVGADGQYSFGGLQAGTYTVSLTPDQGVHLAAGFYATGHTGNYSSASSDATQVAVSDDTALNDITLPAAIEISGTITGCPACTVSTITDAATQAQVTTDAAGRFSLMLAPGEYDLKVVTNTGRTLFYNGTSTLAPSSPAPTTWTSDQWLGVLRLELFTGIGAPPEIESTSPADGAVGVARTITPSVTFTEDVTGVSASTITMNDATTNKSIAATVTYAAGVATLHPASLLPFGHLVRISIGLGITDEKDIPVSPRTITFHVTSDRKAPTISGRTPKSGSTHVSRTADITAVFSEAVAGVTAKTLRLRDLTTGKYVAAVVTYNARKHTATIDPRGKLAGRHRFRVLPSNGIHDLAGITVATTWWTFTTRR